MSKIRYSKKKLPGYHPRSFCLSALPVSFFLRIVWPKNGWVFTSVPASAGASRVNDEDAPNHRVS